MSVPKTGWPAPELMQDDHRGLFRWFASKPDARRQVREAVDCGTSTACHHSPDCADTHCPGHPHMATRRVFWLEPEQEEETSKWPEWFVLGCIAVAFLGAAFLPA